jgi:hypothetical protein
MPAAVAALPMRPGRTRTEGVVPLSASDEEIAGLLADHDGTLARWFAAFMAAEEPGLILTGGDTPSPGRIGQVFDRWVRRSRDQLRRLLCDRLRYRSLTADQRSYGEVATVAAVASCLAASRLPQAVDPVATAALLVARRALDGLCDGATADPPP